jgi:Fe-S oxidoreductase
MSDKTTKTPSYAPTSGLSYDPEEAVYWDESGLRKEIDRVFEVCHGCRMCFKFCDSFPALFRFIDDEHDGRADRLTDEETRTVMDACFQCKLCEVQCPYTPRDGHAFQLDFPKLVHRYRAVRSRGKGGSVRDRILGDPDAAGRAARASRGLANAMNRVALHRWFLEKTLGIHRRKLLPDFAAGTFESWAESTGRTKRGPGGEVVLFQTCYVQNNEPQIGRDTIEVMEHNGVDIRCARGLQCCGMPAWESGNLQTLRKQAKANLDRLEPYVEAGAKVIALNPTCSMMLRMEYPTLVAEEDRSRARRVAEAVRDPGEFLWSIRKEERFKTDFKSHPGPTVAYHAPCHLRAQARGFRGKDLIRKIGGVEHVQMVTECCGHDGTYAMTVEGFEPSARIGRKAFDGMKGPQARTWSTDCPLAAIQFRQHAGVKPLHPMSVLARAYRGDSFEPDHDEGES